MCACSCVCSHTYRGGKKNAGPIKYLEMHIMFQKVKQCTSDIFKNAFPRCEN